MYTILTLHITTDVNLQHNTIESVLERGEKLDDLVDKSRELTLQSKTFYTTVGIAFLRL